MKKIQSKILPAIFEEVSYSGPGFLSIRDVILAPLFIMFENLWKREKVPE